LPPRHFCRRRGRSRPRLTILDILDDFGRDAGLRWLVEGFAARTGIQATLASRRLGRLPDETGTRLFRIAQEALTNVARHVAASPPLPPPKPGRPRGQARSV
jgi:signal transduction histidine kinase